MKETRHTEGPWFVGADEALDTISHKHSGLALVDTGRTEDWPITRLCYWNNARLISAAPELLQVCKDIINYCPFCSVGSNCRAAHHSQLRAAIAKAEAK